MRRTPIKRHTPLRDRIRPGRAGLRPDPDPRPEPPPMDLAAAAEALRRRAAAEAAPPRPFAGPVPDPVAPAKKPDGAFTPATRALILDRDRRRCIRCGTAPGDQWPGLSIQHRIARGMGGTSDPLIGHPTNGITLCGSGTTGCHGWVEHHPTEAQMFGYALPSTVWPVSVPVLTFAGWQMLTADGDAWLHAAAPIGSDALNRAVTRPREGTTTHPPTSQE